jgi:hypothetical protein
MEIMNWKVETDHGFGKFIYTISSRFRAMVHPACKLVSYAFSICVYLKKKYKRFFWCFNV